MNSLKLNTTYEAITKQRLLFQSSVQAGGGGSAVGSPINGRGRLKGRFMQKKEVSAFSCSFLDNDRIPL